jgi:hypothetical protein
VNSSNPLGWGAVAYVHGFTMDSIYECGKAFLEFPCDISLWKRNIYRILFNPHSKLNSSIWKNIALGFVQVFRKQKESMVKPIV